MYSLIILISVSFQSLNKELESNTFIPIDLLNSHGYAVSPSIYNEKRVASQSHGFTYILFFSELNLSNAQVEI